MTGYRIHFINDLRNDSGHIFHCRQGVIEIRFAKTKDRAIEAAKRRFARQERIADWRTRAQSIEVEEITLHPREASG